MQVKLKILSNKIIPNKKVLDISNIFFSSYVFLLELSVVVNDILEVKNYIQKAIHFYLGKVT